MEPPSIICAATLFARSLHRNHINTLPPSALQRCNEGGLRFRPSIDSAKGHDDSAFLVAQTVLRSRVKPPLWAALHMKPPSIICAATLFARSLYRNHINTLRPSARQRCTDGRLRFRPSIDSTKGHDDCTFLVAQTVLRSRFSARFAEKYKLDADFHKIIGSCISIASRSVIEVSRKPEEFPFEIQDDKGKSIVTLRRKYQGDDIEVILGMPTPVTGEEPDYDPDLSSLSHLPLRVRVKKGKGGRRLEFICMSSSLDFLTISAVYLKQDPSNWGMLAYEGRDFKDLGKNMQNALSDYLYTRLSIKMKFLHEYMGDKDNRERLHWLRSMERFVEN